MAAAGLMLFLSLWFPTEILRCQRQTIQDWREALIYGDIVGYQDFAIDGRYRHTLFVSFRKRLLIFVFRWERGPEPGAWHGCGMYDLGYWT